MTVHTVSVTHHSTLQNLSHVTRSARLHAIPNGVPAIHSQLRTFENVYADLRATSKSHF